MQIKYIVLFLFVCLALGTAVTAQPDVTGSCVTISQAKSQGIKGTDCELFAMGFCSTTKSAEQMYNECNGITSTGPNGNTGQTTPSGQTTDDTGIPDQIPPYNSSPATPSSCPLATLVIGTTFFLGAILRLKR
jgi:hypothetical protein